MARWEVKIIKTIEIEIDDDYEEDDIIDYLVDYEQYSREEIGRISLIDDEEDDEDEDDDEEDDE